MAEKQQREGSPENGRNGTSDESDYDCSPTRRSPRRLRHRRSSDRRRPTDEVVRDPPRHKDRPQGRRRHNAGAPNRQPPDHDQALLLAGLLPEDNFPMPGNFPVQEEDEGQPSSRDQSPGPSFAAFSPNPPDSDSPESEPFGGLPPMDPKQAAAGGGGARPKTKSGRRVRKGSRSTAGPSTDQDGDCYMDSASDSDEAARPDAIGVADRRNNNPVSVNNNPAPLPEPEPMCLSSDPE